jgi:hypothetical protein
LHWKGTLKDFFEWSFWDSFIGQYYSEKDRNSRVPIGTLLDKVSDSYRIAEPAYPEENEWITLFRQVEKDWTLIGQGVSFSVFIFIDKAFVFNMLWSTTAYFFR